MLDSPVERKDLVTRARNLVARADGMEEAGMPDAARETRYIARALLEALEELDYERSARIALGDRADEQQRIIGRAAYDACVAKAP